jgi:PKD repeat protein
VQFTGTNSVDPEGQLLTYSWDFGDGTASSIAPNPAHAFNAPAGLPTPYTVTLVVTDNGGLKSTNTLIISINNTPPEVTITSPVDGARYPLNGDTIYNCTAVVFDAEQASSQLTCTWQTFLHHNDHEHSEPIDTDCATTTTISGIGCNGETYYYRVVLTVKDSAGLSTTKEMRLYPDCGRQVPIITWNDPAPIFLGTPLSSVQLNATANTTGTFVYIPPAGTILPVGSGQVLTVSFTPTDTNVYISTTKSVLIDVLPRPLPVVSLTTPTNGAFFNSPASIPLVITVTSNGWSVGVVEFFSNNSFLGENSSPPYVFTWANVTDGAYTLKARALYDAGSSAITSAPVNITVASAPPFAGVKINFQPVAAPVPVGYLADNGAVFGDRGNGFNYGWDQDNAVNMTDRNSPSSPDQRYDTFAATQAAGGGSVWEIAVPNGAYAVFLVAGDPTRMNSTYRYDVESSLGLSGTPTAQTRWIAASNIVAISDGRLTVSNGTGANNNKLCFIDILPVALHLQWVSRDAAGTITLRLEGTAGRNCEIHASTDLLNWQPVATAQNTDGFVSFTDGSAGIHTQRFYRAKVAP